MARKFAYILMWLGTIDLGAYIYDSILDNVPVWEIITLRGMMSDGLTLIAVGWLLLQSEKK